MSSEALKTIALNDLVVDAATPAQSRTEPTFTFDSTNTQLTLEQA